MIASSNWKWIHEPGQDQSDQNQGEEKFEEVTPLISRIIFGNQCDYRRTNECKDDHEEKMTMHFSIPFSQWQYHKHQESPENSEALLRLQKYFHTQMSHFQ
jgi:hypothetical protein